MSDKPFLDTNVLVCALAAEDTRSQTAQELLAAGGRISVQSLNEFVSVVRRKFRMRWDEVREAVAAIEALCPSPQSITLETHKKALQIAGAYGYHIFDSLIVAAAIESKCRTLYSEDLHNGQVIEGLTIRNPFPRTC